jgi:hypothetical protein
MHSILAKELLKLYWKFKSKIQYNFSLERKPFTFDDNLLRRDEIWFYRKKKPDGVLPFE